MKKSLIFVGMLAIGYANAQEGNVGINTENPKATLDITPEANNLTGTTNEGLLIPRLSKARVVAIATDKLVEGTKVYVTDEVTAADTKFIGTGKGFYFYNGTKWVKQLASDTDTNSELWAQRDNAGVTETYLKPADAKEDFVGYRSDRKFRLNLGKVDETVFGSNISPFSISVSSDVLPNTPIGTVGTELSNFTFHRNNSLLKESHTSKNTNAAYYGLGSIIKALDITTPFQEITGGIFGSEYLSTAKVKEVVGTFTTGINGSATVNSTANRLSAIVATAGNYGTVDTLNGIRLYTQNGSNGTARDIRGIFNYTYSSTNDKSFTHKVDILRALDNRTIVQSNGTVGTVDAVANVTYINPNSNITSESRGVFNYFTVESGANVKTLAISQDQANVKPNTTIGNLVGYTFLPQLQAGTNVNTIIGSDLQMHQINSGATVENAYGLKISNVNVGTNKYAIYTDNGTVSLGDRLHIRVNNDVNLTTETPSFMIGNTTGPNLIMDVNEIQTRDNGVGGELFLQTDGGALSINNNIPEQRLVFTEGKLGIGTNRNLTEKLEVNGKIKATSLAGVGNRNVYADENGVLQIGNATATGATTLTGEASLECNASNRGKMNFIPSTDNAKSDVFGICMRNKDGNYYWGYMVGGNNPTNGTGAFGSGL